MSAKTAYEAVAHDEDGDTLCSASELEHQNEYDCGKSWNDRRSRQHGRENRTNAVFQTLNRYRWLVDTALLLVIIGLLVMLLLERQNRGANSSWQVGGDYAGAGPQFSTHVVKWSSDPTFTPLNTSDFFTSDAVLKRWQTLMPSNYGFGAAANGETFSTTSMTHQLHCLYMMTAIYSGLTSNHTTSFPADYHEHYMHCIDYLRQGVMCAGDMSMEFHDPLIDGDDLGPSDGGWSGLHVCKDYGEMRGYLEQQIKDGVRVVLPVDD